MTTKVAAVAAVALLQLSARGSLANALQYLEPTVQRHAGVLPRSVCKHLIELGEKAGFLVREESIDEDEQKDPSKKYVPSQTIDVYEKGSEPGRYEDETLIEDEAIWDALQPWIPKITQIVKENRNKEGFSKFYPDEPDRQPELNWIFFRKYSPNDDRNSLKHHHDTNMNTVNIELADDYEGGGLFYIKPLASTGEIPPAYEDLGYEWIDSLKRENTTDLIFPDLRAGDAIFYNYTVEHGIAPVESGTRYSMAFFFDMDNPAVQEDFEDDSADSLDEGEFEVELKNGLFDTLDILRVYDAIEESEEKEIEFKKVGPNETVVYVAVEGDRLQVVKAGTDELVTEIEMRSNLPSYMISDVESYTESMDNSAIRGDIETYFDDVNDDVSDEISSFDVELHNSHTRMKLDIMLVYDASEQTEVRKKQFGKVYPNETVIYEAMEGDKLEALVSGTDHVLYDMVIKRDQSLYSIFHQNADSAGGEL